jgi:hypothetical protein
VSVVVITSAPAKRGHQAHTVEEAHQLAEEQR